MSAGADRADTIVVLAKQPRPGLVKTRLQPAFAAEEAARLAAAAITDTLAAVRQSRARQKILAWDGDPTGWDEGFIVAPQAPGTFNDRLTRAFAVALADTGSTHAGAPATGPDTRSALLIGMDTPQVTATLLDADWAGADAVLGLSEDGGFWAIGLRAGHPDGIFDGVPMSDSRTGAAQLARLAALGLRVRLLPPLRDVDLPADAERVAADHPRLEFSQTYEAIVLRRPVQGCDRLFDRMYAGADTAGHDPSWDPGRWRRSADPVDLLAVARCEPPVIDLGCGPGRMVIALSQAGLPAMGIDLSRVAVGLTAAAGGPVLRRSIAENLPAEGRWGTALLMDGNIGLGGDVAAMLTRCRAIVAPGGLILVELDPQADRDEVDDLQISSGGVRSAPLLWARIGLRSLRSLADRLGLVLVEEWASEGRHFAALRSVG